MNVVVLGGGSCFGQNLAGHLTECGDRVVCVGRSPIKGAPWPSAPMAHYEVYSIGPDNELILELLERERPEVIVNFAAQGESAASHEAGNWRYYLRTNVEALGSLAAALARRSWLKTFVNVSTSESYGSSNKPLDESAPLRPTSVYAATKACFDQVLLAGARTGQLPAIVMRPSNAYAPGQQLHRVVPKAFLCALSGKQFFLQGGGLARKSYLHADDLSRAIMTVIDRGQPGEIYNAGPSEPISIAELVRLCFHLAGASPVELVRDVPGRPNEDDCYWLDSSRLMELGWKPQVALVPGLTTVLAWMRSHLDALLAEPTTFRMRA